MAVLGDRSVASLLSALAEAPDFSAAASFLLSELTEITGAARACMLRADGTDETLVLVASTGFDYQLPRVSVSLGDLSSPLVISTRSLTSSRGQSRLGPGPLAMFKGWTIVPMSQPWLRSAPHVIPAQRAAELLLSADAMLVTTHEHRYGSVPAGVVVLEGMLKG